jgi:hypothetical protein
MADLRVTLFLSFRPSGAGHREAPGVIGEGGAGGVDTRSPGDGGDHSSPDDGRTGTWQTLTSSEKSAKLD